MKIKSRNPALQQQMLHSSAFVKTAQNVKTECKIQVAHAVSVLKRMVVKLCVQIFTQT